MRRFDTVTAPLTSERAIMLTQSGIDGGGYLKDQV